MALKDGCRGTVTFLEHLLEDRHSVSHVVRRDFMNERGLHYTGKVRAGYLDGK